MIHSENKWTNVTRTTQRKKNGKHLVNLKTLPMEMKIQPMLHSPSMNDPNVNVVKMNSARHQNQCRIIFDCGASVNVFYNKNLIEDIKYVTNP